MIKRILKTIAVLGVVALPATAMAHNFHGVTIQGKNGYHEVVDSKILGYPNRYVMEYIVYNSKYDRNFKFHVAVYDNGKVKIVKAPRGFKKLKRWLKDVAVHEVNEWKESNVSL